MTPDISGSFDYIHSRHTTYYAYNKKRGNKTTTRAQQMSKSLLEIDHYQNALKNGVFNTEKQKILKEKKKTFHKTKK